MQELATKRVATVDAIQRSLHVQSALVDRQLDLARLEMREGVSSIAKGAGILAVGLMGMLLTAAALLISAVLRISLLSARGALFFLAKSYQKSQDLENRLEGWYASRHQSESAPPKEIREVA